jgi:hypothetical protein
MILKSQWGRTPATNGDTFAGCCGSSYYSTKNNFLSARNNQTDQGIILYEGNDLEECNEENGKYICSKVETKNGTVFVKVRTRWL